METHKIHILGRYYSIKGVNNKEYVNRLAEFVDGHMRRIADATGTVDTQKVAILAAMQIADQYFKSQEDSGKKDQELEKSINALSEQISLVLEITENASPL